MVELSANMRVIASLVGIMITFFIIANIFLALWSPITGGMLRDKLYDMLNESNFVNTYGTGMRDSVVYLLDLTVLIVFFGLWGFAGFHIVKGIESFK